MNDEQVSRLSGQVNGVGGVATEDVLLHIEALSGPIAINPLNVVAFRALQRMRLEHVPQCFEAYSADPAVLAAHDVADGGADLLERAYAVEVGADRLPTKWCLTAGGENSCVTELPPHTEILLVNTVSPESAVRTTESIDRVQDRWNTLVLRLIRLRELAAQGLTDQSARQ